MPKHRKTSANTRKKGVSARQVSRIKELSSQGRPANEIQRTLSREGIGLRRTVTLGYVREFKNKPAPTNSSKNVPRKYRGTTAQKTWRRRQRDWRRGRVREKRPTKETWGKRVILQGRINGDRVEVTRDGTGKELYDFVKDEIKNGDWDHRPKIAS